MNNQEMPLQEGKCNKVKVMFEGTWAAQRLPLQDGTAMAF